MPPVKDPFMFAGQTGFRNCQLGVLRHSSSYLDTLPMSEDLKFPIDNRNFLFSFADVFIQTGPLGNA